MRRVVQITSYKGTGSIGRIAEQIGLLANMDGWNCYIASGIRYSTPTKLNEIVFDNVFIEKCHALLSFLFDAQGLGSIISTKKLLRKLDRIHPDLIHLHNIHGYYINYPLLFTYLKKTKVAVIWTLHDCWPFTGHCAHFDAVGCSKWINGCDKCPLTHSYPKSLFFDKSKRNYLRKRKLFSSLDNMTIITVSQWLKLRVEQSFLNKYETLVINNGIDLSAFYPKESDKREKLGIKNKRIVLGVSSKWSNAKGLQEFIELSNDSLIQVVLIGVQEDLIGTLPANLIAIKRTDSVSELAEYYSIADVFVNPTYNDSFPTVNIESLACGTPVVTYNTGGSPEILSPETGVVVEKGDFIALSDAIHSVLDRGKKQYSDECVSRARSLFDKNDRFREYIDLYRRVVNGR